MSLRALGFNTPIEMLIGTTSFKVPLKKFGCVCFVHNTSPSNSKFDAKSHKCVFVAYSSGKKEYKCDDPVKKKMLKSLDVTFKETEFYFVLSTMLPFKILLRWLSLFSRTVLVERGSMGYRATV
jgi:hypothetical protein